MHFTFTNVNYAFDSLTEKFDTGADDRLIQENTRNGPVISATEPVTVTFKNPLQRVLFNAARDCNPFFHVFEALWMLAGRNDVAPLAHYNSNISNYSDDGITFHGAYGHRWRKWFGYDQLEVLIDELRNNPASRRCVLTMWEASALADDDKYGKHDLHMATSGGKDVPCNTQAYFRIVDNRLVMTVCNRSNDLIWGMLGANVVHFSFLQEYVAYAVGAGVGPYHQFTNNLHAYLGTWKRSEWLQDNTPDLYVEDDDCPTPFYHIPLVEDKKTFDRECAEFIDNEDWTRNWNEPFLQGVASPMYWAFELHKKRLYLAALAAAELIKASDWKRVSVNWLSKRKRMWEAKQND